MDANTLINIRAERGLINLSSDEGEGLFCFSATLKTAEPGAEPRWQPTIIARMGMSTDIFEMGVSVARAIQAFAAHCPESLIITPREPSPRSGDTGATVAGYTLKADAMQGMVNVEVLSATGEPLMRYSGILDIYKPEAEGGLPRLGRGVQVENPALQGHFTQMGDAIAEAIGCFGRKYPESRLAPPRNASSAPAARIGDRP